MMSPRGGDKMSSREDALISNDESVNGIEEGAGETACHRPEATGERKSHHSAEMKKKLIHRLNRIEGQVRGVKSMIDKDTYCDEVLHQIASIQSALYSVGRLLLEGHMKSCVIERLQDGDDEVIDELLVTIHKLLK
ncbi:metal-sensitive transcriptional regulator [Paenibacillus thiaminolyticus]|nr:metal-sensitive transcriptional regulator [Paenibacillus thiaminolyticus]WCF10372.1 metal-sensitive transcriptional regulator [Paenibacillus thiaminolyticus]